MKLLTILCFLWHFSGYFCSKIVILPMFGRSHYLVMTKLAEELDKRGHQVTIFVGDEARYVTEKDKFVKTFKFHKAEELNELFSAAGTKGFGLLGFFKFFEMQKNYCDDFLSNEIVQKEMKNTGLIVGDCVYACSALASSKYGINHVITAQAGLSTPLLMLYGISFNPSYFYIRRDASSTSIDTILGRMSNLGKYLFAKFIVLPTYVNYYDQVKTKHGISPSESMSEILRKVDLVLLEKDLILDQALPIPPYVKEVGNFMYGPAKPLQPEWEEFMASSGDDGVIVVSFGSVVDTLDNKVVATMNEAFSRLRQKVIWRLNTDNFQGKIASNVKTTRWLPQNDILGHPKTKLFITHVGVSGFAEAVYHGVPMLCSPLFADQFGNALTAVSIGLGEIEIVKTTTADQLVAKINKVLMDNRYAKKALQVSKVVKMRPRKPVEEAADQIEYLHSVGNLNHLKPRGLELPFYQLYLIDVLLVLLIVSAVVLWIIVTVMKKTIKLCCAQQKMKKL